MSNYCPECGNDRYCPGFECHVCGFPHKHEKDDLYDKEFYSNYPGEDSPEDDIRSEYEWGSD